MTIQTGEGGGDQNALSQLRKPPAYRVERAHVFASDDSLLWFIRRNREQLQKAGALLTITGRTWIHPDRFDAFVLQVGASKAAA